MSEEKVVGVSEDSLTLEDKLVMALNEEFERCMRANDRFLEVSVSTEEMRDLVLKFKASRGELGAILLPDEISINPEQPIPVQCRMLSDEEHDMILEQVQGFMSWLSTDFVQRAGLHHIDMPIGEGKVIPVVPVVCEYRSLRSSFITALMMVYLMEKSQRKVLTATTL